MKAIFRRNSTSHRLKDCLLRNLAMSNIIINNIMIILSHSTEVILKIQPCIYKSHNNDEAKFSEGDN